MVVQCVINEIGKMPLSITKTKYLINKGFCKEFMKIRKSVKNLSSEDKDKFVNAILRLKKSPSIIYPDDSTYSRYDDYVEIHMNAMMAMSDTNPAEDPDWYPGWAHNGPAFLPWHRVYLLQFEKDLQSVTQDDSITVPYWEWTDNDSSPITPDLMGSDGEATKDNSPGKVLDGPFAYNGPNNWTIVVKDESSDPDYLTREERRCTKVANNRSIGPSHADTIL
ncbi:MAG: tyrosinase family protein [Nitrosopumilus sp.]|nr:tyrosinase family protein [Nitrosopumilus sp.]